jgi:hypothetical protein
LICNLKDIFKNDLKGIFKKEIKNNMNLSYIPYDIELIIRKYVHELKMADIKTELNKNFKNYFIYSLTWKGNFDYYKAYNKLENDNNISLFFKNKLKDDLTKINYQYHLS